MVTLAGGMESDFTDSENEIVFSTDMDTPKRKLFERTTKKEPFMFNGSVKNSFRDDSLRNDKTSNRNNQRSSANNFRNHTNNYKNSANFNPQNRNRNNFQKRQCVDFKSDQILDDLRYAIMQGNLEVVKTIFSKGIMVDSILKGGWTGLMYACSFGQYELLLYLLEQGADPNYHKDMFTSLMAVCGSKKFEEDLFKCCQLLLKHGAKVDAHERLFTTPLMFAVREGYSLIVKELLDHGADPNVQDSRGRTALSWAASGGHGQIVRLLLEKGADINIYNQMGQSPIDLAHEGGHKEVASLLQKGKDNLNTESSINLVPKVVSEFAEDTRLMKSSDPKDFIKVGELELFLNGLGVSEFVPTFMEHQITFPDLLIMDDAELEKSGVTQVGVRKKLLEACKSIHKKEWENASLQNLKDSQYISCPDAVAMMANIAKHLKYISTSVIYIRQQIQAHPRILELSQDSANVHNLLDEMNDGMKNIRFLNDELRFLKLHLEKVQDQVQYIPADLIVETVPVHSKQRHLLFAAIGIAALSAAVAGVLWRNPNVLDLVPTSIRIKVPFTT